MKYYEKLRDRVNFLSIDKSFELPPIDDLEILLTTDIDFGKLRYNIVWIVAEKKTEFWGKPGYLVTNIKTGEHYWKRFIAMDPEEEMALFDYYPSTVGRYRQSAIP